MQAASDRLRVTRAAATAKADRRQPVVLVQVVIVRAAHDAIDQDGALAAPRFLERLPEGRIGCRLSASGRRSGKFEVLQVRNKVVLAARRARRDWKVRVLRRSTLGLDLVLRGEPQPGSGLSHRKTHDRAADATHEPVHDRTQERSALRPGGRSQSQPAEDLGFGH